MIAQKITPRIPQSTSTPEVHSRTDTEPDTKLGKGAYTVDQVSKEQGRVDDCGAKGDIQNTQLPERDVAVDQVDQKGDESNQALSGFKTTMGVICCGLRALGNEIRKISEQVRLLEENKKKLLNDMQDLRLRNQDIQGQLDLLKGDSWRLYQVLPALRIEKMQNDVNQKLRKQLYSSEKELPKYSAKSNESSEFINRDRWVGQEGYFEYLRQQGFGYIDAAAKSYPCDVNRLGDYELKAKMLVQKQRALTDELHRNLYKHKLFEKQVADKGAEVAKLSHSKRMILDRRNGLLDLSAKEADKVPREYWVAFTIEYLEAKKVVLENSGAPRERGIAPDLRRLDTVEGINEIIAELRNESVSLHDKINKYCYLPIQDASFQELMG